MAWRRGTDGEPRGNTQRRWFAESSNESTEGRDADVDLGLVASACPRLAATLSYTNKDSEWRGVGRCHRVLKKGQERRERRKGRALERRHQGGNHRHRQKQANSCPFLIVPPRQNQIIASGKSSLLFLSDWYLWLPFYASASFVDLLYVGFAASRRLRQAASLVLWGGVLLLVKVVVEDYVDGCSGLLSLDMRERVVREKLGSGLVVLSMSLQLKVSSNEGEVEERQSSARLAQSGEFKPDQIHASFARENSSPRYENLIVFAGIVALVAVSIGLTLHFFTNVVEHMKKL
ncbi:hypothetical protein ZIOFF_033937 [Zingiber officinale]|uniref:Uncharacterized protein n=1 Tax=Zingiber officinale TaxID=94328 RepID=A0A8J5GR74_ZINOF|nr:hypothetical protein ZIOFF_033937 [Zingiber officinale]